MPRLARRRKREIAESRSAFQSFEEKPSAAFSHAGERFDAPARGVSPAFQIAPPLRRFQNGESEGRDRVWFDRRC
jgi:hypothetical protein